MQDTLKITVIQSDLIWEEPNQNIINFTEKIEKVNDEVDIFLLPEMFTSGFTMNPEHVAETMTGESIKWMLDISAKTNTAVGGSLVITEAGNYFNRFVFAKPDGTLDHYDKRHTFTLAGEDKVYKAGNEKRVIEFRGWKICPLVCYDLRFPVWARNVENYDLLIYVANWPKPRISAWDALLKARSIENMCYCIGVNRVGLDANAYEYPGHSAVYNGLGQKISNIKDDQEQIEVVTLSKSHIQNIRGKLKFLEDKDNFSLSK
jgi:predicted amidohydrolase